MAPVLSKSMEAFASATAAGIGGCFSTLCLYPLDTLKTRMQTSKEEPQSTSLSWYDGVEFKLVQSSTAKFLYFYYAKVSFVIGFTIGLYIKQNKCVR